LLQNLGLYTIIICALFGVFPIILFTKMSQNLIKFKLNKIIRNDCLVYNDDFSQEEFFIRNYKPIYSRSQNINKLYSLIEIPYIINRNLVYSDFQSNLIYLLFIKIANVDELKIFPSIYSYSIRRAHRLNNNQNNQNNQIHYIQNKIKIDINFNKRSQIIHYHEFSSSYKNSSIFNKKYYRLQNCFAINYLFKENSQNNNCLYLPIITQSNLNKIKLHDLDQSNTEMKFKGNSYNQIIFHF